MPPQRKPDQVIVHRLELQRFEREWLEALVITKSANNVLSGIGAALAPFSEVIGIIVAAVVAKEGVDYILDLMRKDRMRNINQCEREYNEYFKTVSQPDFQAQREGESTADWNKRVAIVGKDVFVAECLKKKSDARLNPLGFPWVDEPYTVGRMKRWLENLIVEFDPEIEIGSGGIGSTG